MNEINNRIKAAFSELGLKPIDVITKTGFSQPMVSKILNGSIHPTDKFIMAFCMAFNVSEQWLKTGQGERYSERARLIPVVSMANGGHNPDLIWEDAYPVGEGFKKIECPYDLRDSKAYAVELRGSSMSPRYDEGEIVMVDTTKEVTNGSYAVVKLVNGEPLVKRVRIAGEMIVLESVNQAYEPVLVERRDLEFMHKITHKKEKP